jgi:hypothetical protein
MDDRAVRINKGVLCFGLAGQEGVMLVKLGLAALLLAHAGIHASFVAPRPPATAGGPEWPFTLGHSWILSPIGLPSDSVRLLGLALMAVTIATYALAALTAIGIAPGVLWVPAIAIGSVASLALLVVFFHPWLVLGVAIDAVLVWAVLVVGWAPEGITR